MFSGMSKREILKIVGCGILGAGLFFGFYWLLWIVFSVLGGV